MLKKLERGLFAAMALTFLLGAAPSEARAKAGDCEVEGAEQLQTRLDEHTASETTIMELEQLACAMFQKGDLDTAMEIIVAKKGIILLDGGGFARGREEQLQMFKDFFGAGYAIAFEPVDAHVSGSDDMAWAIGLYRLTSPKGDVDVGKYLSVWEKIDGEWKNVVEMRNSGV